MTAPDALGLMYWLVLLVAQTTTSAQGHLPPQQTCAGDSTHQGVCLSGDTQLGAAAGSTAPEPHSPGVQAFLQSFTAQCSHGSSSSSTPLQFASASYATRQRSMRSSAAHAAAASQSQATEAAAEDEPPDASSNAGRRNTDAASSNG